jgi:S1-C subfamily serine protease
MKMKMRNLTMMAAVLAFSALLWSVASAQDATATVEPSSQTATEAAPSATLEPAAPATGEATAEAGAAIPAQRAYLGVSLLDGTDGVHVAEVAAGSPADAAGLKANDIITALNGTSVTTAADAASIVRALKVGDSLTIDYTRGTDKLTATATLGAANSAPTLNNRGGRGNGPFGQNRSMFGIQYNSDDQSWTITALPENSPLYSAGLREGDVIKTIDGKAYDPTALAQYLASLDVSANVTLSVERSGAAQDIQVPARDLMVMGMRGMFGGMFGGDDDNFPGGNGGFPGNFGQMMPFFQFMYGNGRLGVAFQTLDADIAAQHNLTVTDGALITEVQAGTPAETAGLKVDDVITAVNGEAVDAEHTLRDRLIAYEPGDEVTLTVLRGGASQEIKATLDQPPMPEMGGMFNLPFPGGSRNGNGGFPFDNNRPGRGGMQQPDVTPEATPNA